MADSAACIKRYWMRWPDDPESARLSFVAAIVQGEPDRQAPAGTGPRGRVLLSAIAALAAGGDRIGERAGSIRAGSAADRDRFVAGWLLRDLDRGAVRLSCGAAESCGRAA